MKIKPLGTRKLSLTNKGGLDLFFLGVGSAFTKQQYHTSLLAIKGEDHLLIDCGHRCPQAMHDVGLPVTDVRNILITHSHADHIGGLEELAIMGRYFSKRRPLMVINETFQHLLWETSLRGGLGHNERTAHKVLTFDDFFEVKRPAKIPTYGRDTFTVNVGTIGIKMVRTKHIPDTAPDWQSSFWSCGVIIDDRVFFSSDTRYDPSLVIDYDREFNFEAIFHDCQFFNGGVHAGIDELNQLPTEIKEKLYLMHYGDNWKQFEKTAMKYGFAGFTQEHAYYRFG